MNKYERYAIRQLLLNQLYPPSPNSKLFGSRTLFDVANAWAFFAFNNSSEDNEEKQERKKEQKVITIEKPISEEERLKAEEERIEKFKELNEYVNKPTNNPFIKLDQWFTKCILGCIVSVGRALGKLD